MAVVVDIDHEIGDLSEYDSFISDAGLQVNVSASLGGTSYGMRITIDDSDSLYGQADFTPGASEFRARFYVDPNSLSLDTSENVTVLLFSGSEGVVVQALINWSGAAYRIRLRSTEDDDTYTNTYVVVTDAEHYVEIHCERGAGTGQNRMWIDGSLEATHASLDNDTKYDGVTFARFGCLYPDTGVSGELYLDELVIRDDGTAIGANATTTSTTSSGGTTTTGGSTTTLSGSGSTSTITISSTGTTTAGTTTAGTTTAATTTAATTSAGPTTIKLRDGPGGHTARAAVGDRMVIRSLDSGGVWRETWVEVLSATDPGGGAVYYEYSVERKSGDAVEHPEGATVINYGASGSGMVRVVGEE